MMTQTKLSCLGVSGTRYGASLRKQIKKMEVSQHAKYLCEFCGKVYHLAYFISQSVRIQCFICWCEMLMLHCSMQSRGRLLASGVARIVARLKPAVLTRWSKCFSPFFFEWLKQEFSSLTSFCFHQVLMHSMHCVVCVCVFHSTASAVTVRSTIRRLREQIEGWSNLQYGHLLSYFCPQLLLMFRY